MNRQIAAISVMIMLTLAVGARAAKTIELVEMDLLKMSAGWGVPQENLSITQKPLSIAGRTFAKGIGTHASSAMWIKVNGAKRFTAWVGVDDATKGKGTIEFKVVVDKKTMFSSGVMKGGDAAKRVDIDLTGKKDVLLLVSDGYDNNRFDHANWAEARFEYVGEKPKAINEPVEPKVILTPRPGPKPRIHGPRLFGVRPGKPFIYRIPCTGDRPMTFAVGDLPKGLRVDISTGIITGRAPAERGEYVVTLKAKNSIGSDTKKFSIMVGDKLALTPPMGWNSWYIHYRRVNEQHMRAAADQMVDSGMADAGYMYVNIDDCWMKKRGDKPYRDAAGAVLCNSKFPDIKGMVDYIHAKGLRAGTYISPGPWTCARYVGSYQHEQEDAEKFVEWGFDFLKYDWCLYGRIVRKPSLAERKKPYQLMGGILKKLDRDVVLNMCQYGKGDVWKWGGEIGWHSWRTTGDLGLERARRLPGFYYIGLSNARHWRYAKPGCWNDPDYILIGRVGPARGQKEGRPTKLTGNEQYSYMSMWCLMAAPLIFSGDMAKLDDFTLNVLCNTEVIAVNQDALGKQGRIVRKNENELFLAKQMEDGSLALGLFNLSEHERDLSASWSELKLVGPHRVRDLWRQKDIGQADKQFTSNVGRHGVTFVRLFPVK